MTIAEQVEQRVLFFMGEGVVPPEIMRAYAEESLLYAQRILRDGANQNDPRIIGLAAAHCACTLSFGAEGSPLSFSAGDVRVDCPNAWAGLKEQLRLAMEGAADLLRDGAFVFQAVET